MSAHDHLSPQQFPRYEVGGSEGRNYDDSDKVHPTQFGLPHVSRDSIKGGYRPSLGQPPTVRVPVESLVAGQDYVYRPHVENLSTVPEHVLADTAEPVMVERMPDGRHYITDGTHRSAAARLRGDKEITARLEGQWL